MGESNDSVKILTAAIVVLANQAHSSQAEYARYVACGVRVEGKTIGDYEIIVRSCRWYKRPLGPLRRRLHRIWNKYRRRSPKHAAAFGLRDMDVARLVITIEDPLETMRVETDAPPELKSRKA